MSCTMYIKEMDGTTRTVCVNSEELKNMTLKEFRRRFCPEDEQDHRYIFEGKQLKDDHTLGYYGIYDCSNIDAVIRVRGGGGDDEDDEDDGDEDDKVDGDDGDDGDDRDEDDEDDDGNEDDEDNGNDEDDEDDGDEDDEVDEDDEDDDGNEDDEDNGDDGDDDDEDNDYENDDDEDEGMSRTESMDILAEPEPNILCCIL